ncbi:MAG: helix-turn-helix domain-containing protein [Ruoffia tabacinasalis]|uniref:helix-turn-helix domain-containing protein n=1 Tax=unclassified Ruoffia TaxID=2862149 RepID=UPI0038884F76
MYISNINSSSIKLQSIETESIPTTGKSITVFSENNLTLLYIVKGAADFNVNDREGQVKKRDMILLNPETTLELTTIRKVEWIKITLTGILFTSSLDIDSKSQMFVTEDTSQSIKRYLDLAILEHTHRFRGTELILKKLLECIMVHVLKNSELSIKDASVQVKNDEIERIQQYIRKNYSQKISLDDLSNHVGINKYYLIRLFKQKTGLSPIDYLIHVRLAEAEKLLATSNITISKISDMVGFHSPSHFSKTFKESNHCTPSAFRKKHSTD